nr:MAG TPA: hypothetical protein [Caudoviricetes sp.]
MYLLHIYNIIFFNTFLHFSAKKESLSICKRLLAFFLLFGIAFTFYHVFPYFSTNKYIFSFILSYFCHNNHI